MKKSFVISQQYLLLPIKAQEETRQVAFYCEGKKILEFAVPVSDCGAAGDKAGKQAYAFNYYAPIPMREWMGKEICIEGDVPENFLEAIAFSEEMPDVAQRRPLIHFSANVGWLNDPNGLMYHDGVYHMFFQYNPCDTRWQNMSWGHAVSRDLLHWEQKETALLPDEDGPMYSGSAIVNEQGKLGLPRDAEILFYTCAGSSSKWSEGKKYVQKIAYSTDGKTFQKREGCVLENVAGENRDPKVYWHEGKQVYYMALFLERYDYAIFNSRDLEHWEMTQRLSLPNARECPDLQKVPVEGGGYKWMFWGADGYYFLGDFDGSKFETDGVQHNAYQTMLPYAAQTFWGTDRVIMVPWMRTDNKGKVFTSVMGVPRQLSLVKKGDDFILRQKLADEFENSKERVLEQSLAGGEITHRQEKEAALEVKLYPQKGAGFEVNLYGTVLTMEPGSGRIIIEGIAERGGHIKGDTALSFDKERPASEQISRERLAAQGVSLEGLDEEIPRPVWGKATKEEFKLFREKVERMPSWAQAGIRVLETGADPESISLLTDGEVLEITVDDGLVSDAYETAKDALCGEVKIKARGEVKVEISQIA